jgi:hypothetical protein
MTTNQVLEAMKDGAVLCMEHGDEGNVYWLHPSRTILRVDVGERVIGMVGRIEPGGDSLFVDEFAQTWRVRDAERP